MAIPSRVTDNSRYVTCVTFPYGQQPYVNGHSGWVANTGYVSYWADNARPKPTELFRNGTALVGGTEVERNPVQLRFVPHWSGEGHSTVQLLASEVANCRNAWPDVDYSYLGDMRNQLLEKIKDQSMNLGATLGEYKSTATTVGDLARSIAGTVASMNPNRVLAKAVRVRKDNRTRFQKNLVNSWLAYCYGLRPMMSDIVSSIESLNKRLESGYYKQVQVGGRSMFSHEVTLKTDPYNRNATYFASSRVIISGKTIARYRINSNVKALAEVGITNPLLTAWELVPYSFVFDWIFPVGDYLSSLDALVGVEDLVRVETQKEAWTAACTSGHSTVYTRVSRTQPLYGAPSFTLKYKPSTAMSNMANGLALLMQRRF